MPRELKPKQVSSYRHSTLRISVPIWLNRNDLTFFVKYMGQRVEADSVKEVKILARPLILRMSKLEWKKVIDVSVYDEGRRSGSAGFSLSFVRLEISEQMGEYEGKKKLLRYRRDWPTRYPMDKKWRKELADVHHDFHEDTDGDYRIPYTKESWEGLRRIAAIIEKARKDLLAVVKHRDAVKLLSAVPSRSPRSLSLPSPRRRT